MRLSPRLIDRIVEDLFVLLERQEILEYGEDREACRELFRAAILADMHAEEALDAEVEGIIEQNREKFREVPAYQMFSRIKRQVARDRGFIL